MQLGRVEIAALNHKASKAAGLESMREWQQWLLARGLNETLTVDTMTLFLTRVESTRSSLAETRRMGDRVDAIEYDIKEFRERVKPLAVRHGIQLDPNDHWQLAVVADELIKRLDETRALVSNREQARELEKESRKLLERQEQRSQQVEQEIVALLTDGGTDKVEEFRRRVGLNEARQELERQSNEHLRSLKRISGPGDKFDAYRESLAGSDPRLLAEELEQLSVRQTEVNDQYNTLREERGGIYNELAQLTGEEESSVLRIRRNILLEQLREQAREWSRLTIAESLLEKNTSQVRTGTPARRHPPRPGILFQRHRPEVYRAFRAHWREDDFRDRYHRRQQAAFGTEPGHSRAALPGSAVWSDSGVRRTH